MKIHNHCCEQMTLAIEEQEVAIEYVRKFREYGISILDGGTSKLTISFCPWCGKKLPETLRYKWFDELERLGLDPGSDRIPEEFNDERWYTNSQSGKPD